MQMNRTYGRNIYALLMKEKECVA